MVTAFLSINYEEPHPDTYEGISVHLRELGVENPNRVGVKFHTSIPQEDYELACWYANKVADRTMCSSSVDHFIMDGGDLETPEEPGVVRLPIEAFKSMVDAVRFALNEGYDKILPLLEHFPDDFTFFPDRSEDGNVYQKYRWILGEDEDGKN